MPRYYCYITLLVASAEHGDNNDKDNDRETDDTLYSGIPPSQNGGEDEQEARDPHDQEAVH
jgi:hypothetical protein